MRFIVFSIAIIICSFAKTVGNSEPDHSSPLLDSALEEVNYFSFKKAYTLFEKVKQDSPDGSAPWQQAVFGMAVCAQQMSPPTKSRIEESLRLYRLLAEKYPNSRFAPRSMLNLGRIAELSDYYQDKVDLQGARAQYQKVVDHWPDKLIAGEATFRIASTYVQTYKIEDIRKAVGALEAWLDEHPEDPLASAMWQYLADLYFFPLKQYSESLACYRKAEEIGFLEKGRRGPVYWRMAKMADHLLKKRNVAVEYYTKIIKFLPTSGKAYEAQLALKRLGAPVPPLQLFPSLTAGSKQPVNKDTNKEKLYE